MIRFENLSKGYWVRRRFKMVIDNLNLELPAGRSLALMGRNGAGKSTLLSIIAGLTPATSGRVVSDGTISWPVGFRGSFSGRMTGAQNVSFVARIYGVDSDELRAFVEDFAELGKHFHEPIVTYSSGMKARLAFGLSMGIEFDTYLVDETTAVGDANFSRKSAALFRHRVAGRSAIMVSHQINKLKDYCDAGLVLHNGRLEYFDDLNEAIKRHLTINLK